MRILKVALIVFFSIIGIAGATVLGLFLTGKLEETIIPPADIFYADVTFDEEGNKTYIAHTDNYFVADNFELIIGTTSTEYTQNKLNLDFGTQVAKKYVKINNESLTPYCYSLDENGNQVKYVLAEEADADYITNGKLIAPKTVKIGKAFKVFVCVAPDDDFEGTITEDTQLYNIGGSVVLYAQSEVKSLSRINTTINIDVPVSEIKIIPCTSNGSADKVLDSVCDNYTVLYPTYAYSDDGANEGTAEYVWFVGTTADNMSEISGYNGDSLSVKDYVGKYISYSAKPVGVNGNKDGEATLSPVILITQTDKVLLQSVRFSENMPEILQGRNGWSLSIYRGYAH